MLAVELEEDEDLRGKVATRMLKRYCHGASLKSASCNKRIAESCGAQATFVGGNTAAPPAEDMEQIGMKQSKMQEILELIAWDLDIRTHFQSCDGDRFRDAAANVHIRTVLYAWIVISRCKPQLT